MGDLTKSGLWPDHDSPDRGVVAVVFRGMVLGFCIGTIYPKGAHLAFRKHAKEAGLGALLKEYPEAVFAAEFPGVESPFRAFTQSGKYNDNINSWLMWGIFTPPNQPGTPAEMQAILEEALVFLDVS